MESNEILKELKAVKFALYICAVLLIEIAAQPLLNNIPSLENILHKEEPKPLPTPPQKVEKKFIWSVSETQEALNKGNLDAVIEMTSKRITEYPYDSEPYWYRARAYGMTKHYKEGLKDLDQVERLAPAWKDTYIEPLRKAFRNNMMEN